MNRAEVSHILRAAQAITKEREFVLIGSQAAHLQLGEMPDAMQLSGELDIYPLRKPKLAVRAIALGWIESFGKTSHEG